VVERARISSAILKGNNNMIGVNNPAGRLYLLLADIRSQPNDTTLQRAWAHALNIDEYDVSNLIVLIAEVVRLVEEVKGRIGNQNVDQSLYLKPFVKIQRVFTLSFGHQMTNAKEFLDDATMTGLEYCSELLARTTVEEAINADVLTELQADVDILIEKMLVANLPEDLKLLLLDCLQQIRQAILSYRIHGAKGIEAAIKTTIGSVHYYTMHAQEQPTENYDKETFREFISFLEKVLSIVANALNINLMISGIVTRLLGPGA
jgi:hypothetical protein